MTIDTSSNLYEILGIPEIRAQQSVPENVETKQSGPGFFQPSLRSGLLCTARSGSSLLSVNLQSFGFCFEEYLNRNGILKDLIERNQVGNLIELAKHFESKATVQNRLSTKIPPATIVLLFMMGEFPRNLSQWKFVHLKRKNVVRQAISGYIAKKTGSWTSRMPAKIELTDNDYDFNEIRKVAHSINNGNRLIENFISFFGIEVLKVIYEEYVKDQPGHTKIIASYLGVDSASYEGVSADGPWIKKQSNQLNENWEQKFLSDVKKIGAEFLT